MSNVTAIDHRPNIVAGARPMAIVPKSMDDAYRLAKAVCLSGLAPKGLDKPEACMVAILHGLEIGLTPMTALQRIAVVNGRPTIFGDAAISLVRASGLCEYVHEWMEGDTAICEAKRRGESEPIVRKFSVADAKQAGLLGKAGPWTQFRDRMLQMRARAFALRDGFADVLGGLYLKEEMDERGELPDRAPRQISAPASPQVDRKPDPDPELLNLARAYASHGSEALNMWLEERSISERLAVSKIEEDLNAIAAQADAEHGDAEARD